MILLNHFKMEFGEKYVDHLPTVMTEYLEDYPLKNLFGISCKIDPHLFCKHIDRFQSIFDGCAYGQYLGGVDSDKPSEGPGYINYEAFFIVAYMDLIWENDAMGRRVPFAIYNNKKYRINNLHIHSKNLSAFTSTK
jgi:hypothetical protein